MPKQMNYWKWLFFALLLGIAVYIGYQYFYGNSDKSEEYVKLELKYQELANKISDIDIKLSNAKKAADSAQKISDSKLADYLNQKPTNYKDQYEKDIHTYRTNSVSQNQLVLSDWLHRHYNH